MENVDVRVEAEAKEVRVSEDVARQAVCQTIAKLLYTSELGVEQLQEVCNRVEREIYE